jgi:hypothetical protein
MGLLEFVINYSDNKLEIREGFKKSDFWSYLEVNFPNALQNFADKYYQHIVGNCDAETIDIYDLEQPEIDELYEDH